MLFNYRYESHTQDKKVKCSEKFLHGKKTITLSGLIRRAIKFEHQLHSEIVKHMDK